MEQEHAARIESLCRLIDEAFDGVVLGDGIGLWEAQGLDDMDDAETCANLRAKDEKEDWRKISYEDLNICFSSPGFLDAPGMRFHLPAFLIAELRNELGLEFHYRLLNFNYHDIERYSMLNSKQRLVVRAFLLFLGEWCSNRSEILRELAEYWTEESCRSVI